MSTYLVTTTIHDTRPIDVYARNIERHGHGDAGIIIIGDRKTPRNYGAAIRALRKRTPVPIDYLDLDAQKKWLGRFPAMARLLPFDSVQRRNIGYLVAAEKGADLIIAFDDDNFPGRQTDFVGAHRLVNQRYSGPAIATSSGWLNTCSFLKTTPPRRVYHRGFPLSRRWKPEKASFSTIEGRVGVNVGLWYGDPDVDTVTRLEEPFRVDAIRVPKTRVAVRPGVRLPFNSQNTGFSAELLPCLFLITLRTRGEALFLNNNFRYDDIWMSYFVKKAMDRVGDLVVVGPPHVEQLRNEHNLLADLRKELMPMELTDVLVAWLEKIKLRERAYAPLYRELTEALRARAAADKGLRPEHRRLFADMVRGMDVWSNTVAQLTGRR